MKITIKALGFLVTLVFCYAYPVSTYAGDDIKFGIGAIASYYNIASSELNDVDAHFDTVPIPGITGTYFLNNAFSVEVSTQYLTTDMHFEIDGTSGEWGEIEQIPLLLTGRFQFPIRKTNTNIYLGLGAGYFINRFDKKEQSGINPFFPLNNDGDIKNSFGWHANVGTEMFFKNRFSIYLDLKAIFNEAEFEIIFPDSSRETKDVGLNASIFGFGFKYYF